MPFVKSEAQDRKFDVVAYIPNHIETMDGLKKVKTKRPTDIHCYFRFRRVHCRKKSEQLYQTCRDESTADMVCPVADLIAAASEVVTLEPGDVIATGTPSGVGAGRGLYLRGGDVVRVTIDGLGTLENTVKENP